MSTKEPIIPLEIVEFVEEMFPDKAGEKNDSHDDRVWKAAQAHVGRFLRDRYTRQTQNYARTILERSHNDVHVRS